MKHYGPLLLSQYNTTEFKKLQAKWYRKLGKNGFKDIENTESPQEMLHEWASRFFHNSFNQTKFTARREYYYRAEQFLYSHSFESALDLYIWESHASGKSLREIAEEIKKRKIKMNKDTINKIIHVLRKIMLES